LRNPLTAMKILVQKAARAQPANGLTGRDLAVLEAETARPGAFHSDISRFRPAAHAGKMAGRPPRSHPANLGTGSRPRRGAVRANPLPTWRNRPLMIEADHEQLHQLFLNLVCNALDTLPQGGSIRITAVQSEPMPGRSNGRENQASADRTVPWITITIADTGPGIPQDLGDRIFEPYVSTKDTGIGLGLAICRRIVQSHGGEIIASDAPQGGAVFTVRLPKSTAP